MTKDIKYTKRISRLQVNWIRWIWIAPLLLLLGSCEDFFDPGQDLVIDREQFFADWSEYRAAEMGLYGLQQNLVEQMLVLGELRADLLEITANADRDLTEIYNFQISRENKYASPANFYKLIGACNSLSTQLEMAHPEVLDDQTEITDYDRLYGEVLCMRAWAYFNAVRIYGKVPYIWPSLTTVEEINEYVNTPGQYVDTLEIVYHQGGYYNDTIRKDSVILMERKFLDTEAVIDSMVRVLTGLEAVGVLHNKENNDASWEATVWSNYSRLFLLGQMYLTRGDLAKAEQSFYPIMYYTNPESSSFRFALGRRFQNSKWRNIFQGIDVNEHILTLWFNKSYQQQHDLQKLFSVIPPNQYMLKPSRLMIEKWEGLWDGMKIDNPGDEKPEQARTTKTGIPGDFNRGHGVSFAYILDEEMMEEEVVREMLEDKRLGNEKNVETAMTGVDTVVYKYTLGKNSYDQDADFILYRASSVHLYYAEIYSRFQYMGNDGVKTEISTSRNVLNDGSYRFDSDGMGVRGRVGFGDGDEAIYIGNIVYKHDPVTNEIIGFTRYPNLYTKQLYMEDQVLEERARELAFEGERFYDLMRIAKRRNDPSYLADRVAAKFPPDRREAIRTLLMNENNWYVPYFE